MSSPHPPTRSLEFVTADGLTLRGFIAGEGVPRILMLSGVGLPIQTYAPAMATLGERGAAAFLNHRGHGDSDNPAQNTGWMPYQRDLEDFVTKAMEPPIVLAGHSFGSMIGLWLASEHPEWVEGLILLDPLFPADRPGPWPRAAAEREQEYVDATYSRRSVWPSMAAADKFLRGRGIFTNWEEEPFQQFLKTGLTTNGNGHEVGLACPLEVDRVLFGCRKQIDAWPWVAGAKAPTAIIRGAASHVSLEHGYRGVADALPLGTVYTVPGGHTFMMEHPAATRAVMTDAWELLQRSKGGQARGL